ncbi:MAG: heme-binding protein [Acidobacteriota bacterium]
MLLKRTLTATAFAAISLTTSVQAQAPKAAPAASATTPYGMAIAPDAAKKVAAAAIAEARKNGWSMAVSIVDTGGYLVYFERMPDTQLGSVQVSLDKAKSAALFRRPTKVFQDAVAGGGDGLRMLGLTGAVPVDGGIPLIVDGKVVGAIGASGGTSAQDGQTAQAGASNVK